MMGLHCHRLTVQIGCVYSDLQLRNVVTFYSEIRLFLYYRYVAALRTTKYHDIITKKRVIITLSLVWLFSAINTAPILAGDVTFRWVIYIQCGNWYLPFLTAWMTTVYDNSKYVCVCFDGTFPLYYTLGPVFIGHFIPHAITIFCYVHIIRVSYVLVIRWNR